MRHECAPARTISPPDRIHYGSALAIRYLNLQRTSALVPANKFIVSAVEEAAGSQGVPARWSGSIRS